MRRLWMAVRRLARAEHGQDLIEYGMLAALIAVVAISAVTTLGTTMHNVLWNLIANNL
jgi:Flp pilus assembly pilin Flp